MPLDDRTGQIVTTESAAAVRALDAAADALLGHRADVPRHLLAALAADPDLALGHAWLGLMLRLAARRDRMAEAGRRLALARAAVATRGATPREVAMIAALAAWEERGDMEEAAARLEAGCGAAPPDPVRFKLAQTIRFLLGDAAGMREASAAMLPRYAPGQLGRGFILGCHAFNLEETGEARAAEALGREAVALDARDLWAAHAVGHVMEGEGRAAEGIAWLAGVRAEPGDVGYFARHIVWHQALFHLHLGQRDAALALFDGAVHQPGAEDVRDIANAVSLLWRLQAQGAAPGTRRWDMLAAACEARIGDHALGFAEAHYALCLALAGRAAALETLIGGMRRTAQAERGTQPRLLGDLGAGIAGGIAHAQAGDAAAALALLLPLRSELRRIGGSNAQRDLFDRLILETCVAACRWDAARSLLGERRASRAPGVWEAGIEARLPPRMTARPSSSACRAA
ncbi:MAG TPA: hypothetical protein VGM87_21280 [Roseomonas sp.]